MDKWAQKIGEYTVRWRWAIISIGVLLAIAAGSGQQRLGFSNDSRVYFSHDDHYLRLLEAIEKTYNRHHSVVFVIAPHDGKVFTPQALAAIEELTNEAWQIPFSQRVDSLTNFQYTSSAADHLIINDLVENANALTKDDISRIQNFALQEPTIVNRLVSDTGHVAGVVVNVLKPDRSPMEIPKIAAYARTLAEKFHESYPNIDFHLTGLVMTDNAFSEASQDDLHNLVPLMYLVLAIIALIALRSFISVIAAMSIVYISMTMGMGLAGWSGIILTPTAVNAPTIILTLAVADSIHILTAILHFMKNGMAKNKAIIESIRINLQPIIITSVTTAIGFLSLNFSKVPPFRDMGNIVTIGVIVALVYSIFFLPAIVSVLPLRVKYGTFEFGFHRLSDFVIRRRQPIFAFLIGFIILSLLGLFRIDLNDNWIKYFDSRYDIRYATDFAESNLTGLHSIEYSLASKENAGISNTAYLKELEAFASWYRTQPKVVHVSVITDTIKRINRNLNGDDPAFYRIPEQDQLAAQYLLLYEMSLPFGLDLNSQVNVDKTATRMIVTLRHITTRELLELDTQAFGWLNTNASTILSTRGSGLSVIWAHLAQQNIKSLLVASIGALFLIAGILIVVLKSIRIGLISMLPNISPAMIAFGIWGLTISRVGLGMSVVISLTLGIVVDDTVHFLSKYLRARREYHFDPIHAIRYAFDTVGDAMWITTVILVGGFMVLTFSGYRMNADMGLMVSLTILIALLIDFLFLPALLIQMEGKSLEKNTADRNRDTALATVSGEGPIA